MNLARRLVFILAAAQLAAQTVEVAPVEVRTLSRTAVLTGELLPFQRVDLHARVPGFVQRISVDRGAMVREGQILAELSAPELEAQIAGGRAKVQASEAAVAEAKARLLAAQSTLVRLEEAARTDGAVAGIDLIQARQAVEAAGGALRAAESTAAAAQSAVSALVAMAAYLEIRAPFDAVVTERLIHPGALVGPSTGPLLRLEQTGKLRLVVAVPEQHYSTVRMGAAVEFTVAAHPEQTFRGAVARFARSLDAKTRTMAVELDVPNPSGALAPGLFAEVRWPVQSPGRTFVVPTSSVVRTTERVFVIRVKGGRAEWVDVRAGARTDTECEVYGPLAEGDLVVRNASDEIRQGAEVKANRTGPGKAPR
jgi:RND family efflux transporter MFP subunit